MITCTQRARELWRHLSAAAVALVLSMAACGCRTAGCPGSPGAAGPAPQSRVTDWRAALKEALPVLGHRNWIVIADAAYPDQTAPGIRTLYTGARQLDVVKAVLQALDGTRHVRPIINLDAELNALSDRLAPGVEAYRADLDRLLAGRRVVRQPHEQLIAKLDQAGQTFRILILKTDLTIPYTSVFLQLDCGYWGPDQEKRLREAIHRP